MVATDRWGEGTLRAARRIAARALDGVGVGESVETLTPVCLHVRRGLSADEIATLDPEWLAIPARDEFMPEAGIEKRL